jgi:hypothetical protein
MSIDLHAATSFMATNARILDRRRFHHLHGDRDPDAVVAALEAYRNGDGGYGWGLEPDLRSAESQPAAALHAFEVLAEAAPLRTPRATELCDWLNSISLPDGGLPFALPIADPTGCAPFWVDADPTISSLQITSAVAACAHHVARHDPSVADHPWLAAATRYCLEAINALEEAPPAYELSFALRLVDTIAAMRPEGADLLERLGRYIPANGTVRVQGGTGDEMLRPLDLSPDPDGPVRGLFDRIVIAADLDRLARGQQPDGGWSVDWVSPSPAAALEWRGYATVDAVTILRTDQERKK